MKKYRHLFILQSPMMKNIIIKETTFLDAHYRLHMKSLTNLIISFIVFYTIMHFLFLVIISANPIKELSITEIYKNGYVDKPENRTEKFNPTTIKIKMYYWKWIKIAPKIDFINNLFK